MNRKKRGANRPVEKRGGWRGADRWLRTRIVPRRAPDQRPARRNGISSRRRLRFPPRCGRPAPRSDAWRWPGRGRCRPLRGNGPRPRGRSARRCAADPLCGMPMPVSATVKITSSLRASALSTIFPPGSVYWMALSSKFCKTSCKRRASPATSGRRSGSVQREIQFLFRCAMARGFVARFNQLRDFHRGGFQAPAGRHPSAKVSADLRSAGRDAGHVPE